MKGKEKIDSNALFLIDGSYFLYRSYFALPPLHNSKGRPTQATYAFARTISKLIKTLNPRYLAVVWDTHGGSKQNKELFANYKATRPEPPKDLFLQKEDIFEFLELVGIKNILKQGFEADDLIGSLVQDTKNTQIVLVCPDKDMYQLLDDNVIILDPFKDRIIDAQLYQEESGIPPHKVAFFHALLGDSSDNIPGVKGIGKKTALDLVTQFESLDDMYTNIDHIEKKRTQTLLEESRDNAHLSLKLFTLDYTKLDIAKTDCQINKDQWRNALPFFKELELTSLIKETEVATLQPMQQSFFGVPTPMESSLPTPEQKIQNWKCKIITTIEELDNLVAIITEKGFCGMDTETTGALPLQDKMVGLSFAVEYSTSYYIPLLHPESTIYKQLPTTTVIEALSPMLESPNIKKYLHNAKFDELVLWHAGITLRGVEIDTLIAASVTRTNPWQKINLKDLSMHFFNEPMLKFKDVVGTKYKEFSEVPIELAAPYAAHDALQTLKLKDVVVAKLLKDKRLNNFFTTIEMPLYHVLVNMEKHGVTLDAMVLKTLEQKTEKKLTHIEEKIFAALPHYATHPNGDKLNLNSPKQIEHLLFTELNLPHVKKTETGEFSTDNEVLVRLSKIHPIPSLIIEYREFSKLLNTYLKPLPECVNPETGKIHTSFSQTMVVTGRLSSNNPNLQNIPVEEDDGIKVRSAFIASPGNLFLSADYSQIELRVLAHLTQDRGLIDAFKNNKDVHTQTASQLFSITPEEVTHEQRKIGKRINFSIIYGLTAYSLAKEFEITPKDAQAYIDGFFQQYPLVETWMNKIVQQTQACGYVESLWGKRRYISELQSANKTQYNTGRRYAINTPVQGTQADIVKIAMINISAELDKKKLQAAIILQIHDEIVIEFPHHEEEVVRQIVQHEMEHVVSWEIPLSVSIRTGSNWAEVTK